jgi:formate hydrogenlyase subunit 3/multisubunit Na+/H+ antiporter MnhD subunit
MKWFLNILGVLMILAGIVWILQGTGKAFTVGLMAYDIRWAYAGAGLILVAVVMIIFANLRKKKLPPSN